MTHDPADAAARGSEPRGDARAARRGGAAAYLAGYGLSLALTAAAFAAVRWPQLPARATFAVVLSLGLAQVLVHFRCFLRVGFGRSSRANLLLALFSALIIALMVSGTLVVLFNLRERMM